MTEVALEKEWYLNDFKVFEKTLNGQASTRLHHIRQAAIDRFARIGFPSRRQEAWRFTNIEPVKKIKFKHLYDSAKLTADLHIEPYKFAGVENHLVFVNGYFSPQLSGCPSLPDGVVVESLATAIKKYPDLVNQHLAQYVQFDDHAFAALNTAFMVDGAFVYIPQNVIVEKPIHLLFLSGTHDESILSHPRNLIVLDKSSQATVLESYVGKRNSVYFTNPVTEVVMEDNAIMEHYKIERESEKAFHIAVQNIEQKRNSRYVSHNYSFGGSLVRNDLRVVLDGENVDAELNGLYMLWDDQLCDNHTLIEHARPNCRSRELYKGILDDHSRAVFNGKILVHPNAQKTDAVQANKNLLLSDDAKVDTQPQLEIYADDVKCTHGGTVGQMDRDGIFYLRTRGIDEAIARSMIIHSFAGEVLQHIKIDSIRDKLDKEVVKRLNKRFHANEKN